MNVVPVVIYLVFAITLSSAQASDWSESAKVLWNYQPVVTYRARIDRSFLVVEVSHQPGWHTYAMDNRLRASERLAGRKSLGIDGPTSITVSDGLEVSGGWYQSPPNDYSKPELRWFTWGFADCAMFVAPMTITNMGPAKVAIRGQACDEKSCRNIEIDLRVPLGGAEGSDGVGVDFGKLIKVRQKNAARNRRTP